jgi:Mg/Co/Ni transporter MgtE
VGLLNGLGFGLITGVVAALWFQDWNIGAVIAIAMTVNLVAGALGGILIPPALERAEADPAAVSSGVFVTTVDGCRRLLLVSGNRDPLVRHLIGAAIPAPGATPLGGGGFLCLENFA